MKALKISISAFIGGMLFLLAFIACFPRLALLINGPVLSNDEMNQNTALFVIGAPLTVITGALIGGFYMRHRLNKKHHT